MLDNCGGHLSDTETRTAAFAVSVADADSKKEQHSSITAVMSAWQRHNDVLRNASSLIGTTGVTSVMGFAFWALAARLFSQRAVGYGSAAVSAMTLLGTVGMFGLGTVLIGELPQQARRGSLVSAALLVAGLGSLVLGLGFAVIAPFASSSFHQIMGTPARTALFALSVMLIAVGFVFDQATIGLLRGGIQLSRNFVFSLAKLALLPIVAVVLRDQYGTGIAVSYAAGVTLSLVIVALWLRFTGTTILPHPDMGVMRGLGRTTLAHNWLNLAIAVPYTLVPVLVTLVVSPTANADFYAAWMISGFLFMIPQHLSTVLYAVAAADPQAIARKLRFTLSVSILAGFPGMAVVALTGHLVLSVFGANYARQATLPLELLVLSYLPTIPKAHYIAVCRAVGKVSRAAVVLTAFSTIEIIAAVIGGMRAGLVGLSLALLGVMLVEGIVTTPAVLRSAGGRGRHRFGSSVVDGSKNRIGTAELKQAGVDSADSLNYQRSSSMRSPRLGVSGDRGLGADGRHHRPPRWGRLSLFPGASRSSRGHGRA
jgi:O-antigen/teichoic acid export membrane protein